MGVSWNGGTSKSSIQIRFCIRKHLFWGTPIYGHPQLLANPSLTSTQICSFFLYPQEWIKNPENIKERAGGSIFSARVLDIRIYVYTCVYIYNTYRSIQSSRMYMYNIIKTSLHIMSTPYHSIPLAGSDWARGVDHRCGWAWTVHGGKS